MFFFSFCRIPVVLESKISSRGVCVCVWGGGGGCTPPGCSPWMLPLDPPGEYSPRRSRGEYSPIITEPEANNCFSINTQVIISKKEKKKTFQREIIFTYSGKTTTGSHFVRRGDYNRLIIRDSEPMRARDFV